MKNGIINETNQEYHRYREAISKSQLIKINVCPKYFKWCEDKAKEPTADLIFGNAFHKWVLERDTFYEEFAISPCYNKRKKDEKEAYERFVAKSKDKQIIAQDEFDKILLMANEIENSKYCNRLLNGEHEKSIYFVDNLTNELCKVRPDCYRVIKDRVIITDLKSCRSSKTEDFMRDVTKYGYDLQAYMYSLGLSKVLNVPIENIDFVFIAVDKNEPYLINVLQADKYIFERGETLFRKYIGIYHHCKDTNNWYGLNGEEDIINNLTLPNYMLKDIDNIK